MEDKVMENNRLIVICGCGGQGHNVADVLLFNDPNSNIVFVDANAREGETILGFSVEKNIPMLSTDEYKCIVAIGNVVKRKKKFDEISDGEIVSAISKSTFIGQRSTIGDGCYVGHLCMIGPEVKIGKNSLIGATSIIGHETEIGEHCFIAPHTAIAGRVQIGDLVFIGAGATVIDYIKICSNTIVGAGATVLKDIAVPGTYVGTPARRIK
jgi:UDP-N-acetylbacillosamine N-acetyltransferase